MSPVRLLIWACCCLSIANFATAQCPAAADTVSDGRCDPENNIEDCEFDGGDCCPCDCEETQGDDVTCGLSGYDCLDMMSECYGEPQCTASVNLVADGNCNAENNNEDCQYDGGDCCSCDCVYDGGYPCGTSGYNCLDVNSSCYGDPSCGASPTRISNGWCDSENNIADCEFDGGDCCQCDCEETQGDDVTCGVGGYDCLDMMSECYGEPQCSASANLAADGNCNAENNNEDCQYDGGDCCSCDCVDDGDYPCGTGGYNCLDVNSPCYVCASDDDCADGYVCCEEDNTCKVSIDGTGACGDPHMTGFRGQKFDFTGEDEGWYAVVSDMPHIHLNMRVTSPVPSVPEITYITGLGITTMGDAGLKHTIVITVTDPHSLDSACPVEVAPCLADGALTVELDGEVTLLSPGEVELGPNVALSAVNLPGACRSFGFEQYWELKRQEYARGGRRLSSVSQLEEMSDWILGDPTATNMAECTEYVVGATENGSAGLLEHDSEHTSFQILTPKGKIRLSHGRLHQLATRDPTDSFDIPDHLTWQMNLSVDHIDLRADATGILGETQNPTLDANGHPIMQGMAAIRGAQNDYLVKGPLDTVFAAAHNHA